MQILFCIEHFNKKKRQQKLSLFSKIGGDKGGLAEQKQFLRTVFAESSSRC